MLFRQQNGISALVIIFLFLKWWGQVPILRSIQYVTFKRIQEFPFVSPLYLLALFVGSMSNFIPKNLANLINTFARMLLTWGPREPNEFSKAVNIRNTLLNAINYSKKYWKEVMGAQQRANTGRVDGERNLWTWLQPQYWIDMERLALSSFKRSSDNQGDDIHELLVNNGMIFE